MRDPEQALTDDPDTTSPSSSASKSLSSSASESESDSESYEDSPYVDTPKPPVITSLDDVAERIKSGESRLLCVLPDEDSFLDQPRTSFSLSVRALVFLQEYQISDHPIRGECHFL